MLRYTIIVVIALFLFSSCEKPFEPTYPEVIKEYGLEDKHDIAKWTIYKLSTIRKQSPVHADFYFNITALLNNGPDGEERLRDRRFLANREKMIREIGEENVKHVVKLDLKILNENRLDTCKGGWDIFLGFYPKSDSLHFWERSTEERYYIVYFRNDSIVNVGDRAIYDYPYELQIEEDQLFLEAYDSIGYKNPWIDWYIENKLEVEDL